MNEAIVLRHVSKRYGEQILFEDLSFSFPKTGLIGIEGPSGCGKSTLLGLLSLQISPDAGSIWIHGEEASSWKEEKKAAFRLRRMGIVVQKEELVKEESASWNVALPSLLLEERSIAERKSEGYLCRLGLALEKEKESSRLSGGEKQRVHLARALMNDPEFLFADEPTSALDLRKAEEVMDLLEGWSKKRLVVVVSHDGKRLRRHCDRLFRLREGRLEEEHLAPKEIFSPPASVKPCEISRDGVLPLREHLAHARRKKKTHRVRGILMEASLALGLFGVGMASYLSSSLQGQISSAYEKIVPPHTIVMERNASAEDVEARLATAGEAAVLRDAFPEEIACAGKVYLYDFESSFPDDRFLYYRAGVSEKMLPSFSARTINDFLLLSKETPAYPSSFGEMKTSEVVLGLPYESMAILCRDFGLARGYASLGRKLEQSPLSLSFRLSSVRWGLEEELRFEAIAVVESPLPLLYHTDPSWNERIFEGVFRFHDVGIETPQSPQETRSIRFVEIRGSPSAFIREAKRRKETERFLFDFPSSAINSSFVSGGERVKLPRLYLYVSSSRGISPYVFDEVSKQSPRIVGRLPVTPGGYFASVESALSGFAGRFFLAKEEQDADALEKAYADMPLEQSALLGKLPPNCVEGSVQSSGAGGLSVSADLSWMKEPPREMREVALSQGLFEALGSPEEICVLAEIASERVGETLSREFARAWLRVVAVREEKRLTLYVPSDWTTDFYIDGLHCSPLAFEATGALFFLNGEGEEEEEARRLQALFQGYRFASPSALVQSSLAETTSYLSIVLKVFSAASLSTSAILFVFVAALGALEGRKEAHGLRVLGLKEKEIARFSSFSLFLAIFEATLSALLALLLSEGLVSLLLAKTFQDAFSFHPSPGPLAAILAFALSFALLAYLAIPWLLKEGGRKIKGAKSNESTTRKRERFGIW